VLGEVDEQVDDADADAMQMEMQMRMQMEAKKMLSDVGG
jgi:hypothetical protein